MRTLFNSVIVCAELDEGANTNYAPRRWKCTRGASQYNAVHMGGAGHQKQCMDRLFWISVLSMDDEADVCASDHGSRSRTDWQGVI
jgi:hypothetical protein